MWLSSFFSTCSTSFPHHNPFCRLSPSQKLYFKWKLALPGYCSGSTHFLRRAVGYKFIIRMQSKIWPHFNKLNVIKIIIYSGFEVHVAFALFCVGLSSFEAVATPCGTWNGTHRPCPGFNGSGTSRIWPQTQSQTQLGCTAQGMEGLCGNEELFSYSFIPRRCQQQLKPSRLRLNQPQA